jgi:hypothetical protein
MSHTIDAQDLAARTEKTLLTPQRSALSTAPNRKTHRPIFFPPKGHHRILPGVRNRPLGIAFGRFWGTMWARLAAIIVAVLVALSLSSLPIASADQPPSANPCDIRTPDMGALSVS